ncbi:MAG: TetR/AcrR family transcriptional regulator [Actinomycetota bacterium]|nr:TetR/AcrR family transcriptional regulator [Actinomycetota bacterium]
MTAGPTLATRDRILAASTELMRRNGYAGTGVKAILAASGAPYGSLYHHFPGGKEQLGTETLRQGGVAYLALVESFYTPDADVRVATRVFFEEAAAFVESTDFVDACPIATIAGEIANTSDPMRAAAAEAFESWLAVLASRFVDAGIARLRSRELAIELFCAIEGAFLLARTTGDGEPIRIAGRAAEAAVRTALATSPQHARVAPH